MAKTRGILVGVAAAWLACASAPSEPAWDRSRIDEYFDSMVDRHLEAGYEDPILSTSDPLLAQRTIVVTTTLNERTVKDVIARLLYLSRVDPAAPIDLVLSTQGGWLDPTFALVDTIEMIQAPVNVWGLGGVYSAGSLVLASASGRRLASRNAIIMVHANLQDGELDRSSELRLERFEELWRRRAKLPEEWFPMTRDVAHYLSPEEALQYGIIDEILDGREFPPFRD